MVHHRTSLWNHNTNQSLLGELCWSIEVSWRKCFIIGHRAEIALQINHSQQSCVEVLKWVEEDVSSSDMAQKSQYESIIRSRDSWRYRNDIKRTFHCAPIIHNLIKKEWILRDHSSTILILSKKHKVLSAIMMFDVIEEETKQRRQLNISVLSIAFLTVGWLWECHLSTGWL